MLDSLPVSFVLIVAGTFVIWKCSDRIETASLALADHYGLPEIVRGSVVMAVSSSFPELSSAVIATLVHEEFELGVAVIVGSAIFNILVIPSASVLMGGRNLPVDRGVIYKETLFYMIAVCILLITLSLGVIYFPVYGECLQGRVPWGLGLIPLGFYFLYLFIQFQDTKAHNREKGRERVRAIGRSWLMLLICMVLVAVAVEGLVRSAINLGRIFGTPSFLWGLTVIAAATSLPDMFLSVRAAKRGKSVASLSNVLGSNTFDLLVAVPAGVLLAGSVVFQFGRAVPMMGFLMAATVLIFVLMRRNMELARRDAWLMIGLYIGFVVWMSLESLGVLGILSAGESA